MKKTLIIISMLLTNMLFANEKIKEVGKVDYDQKTNTFIFYFIKDNNVKSVVIHPTDKEQIKQLKVLKDKIVILDGEIKSYVKNNEGFSYREEVDNSKVRELNKELLKIDTKKVIAQYNLVSHEKDAKKIHTKDGGGIGISDEAAHSIISVAGSLVGIAAGPIAILPAAAYMLNEAVTK